MSFQKAWGSGPNGAPRSTVQMWILMGLDLSGKISSLLNEAPGPSTPLAHPSSLFLTSARSDSLPSHRKSGEQRPWSTLITCTPPLGSFLPQMTRRAVNVGQACACACVCEKGNWVTITGDEQIEFSHHTSMQWDSLFLSDPSHHHNHLPPTASLLPLLQSPQLSVYKCMSPQNLK